MIECNNMSFGTIYEKLQSGDYKVIETPVPDRLLPACVFDSSKSVDWDRAMLDDADKARLSIIAANRDANAKMHKAFHMDVLAALKSEYSLTAAQANIVFACAYESNHHSGCGEILNVAQSLGGFAEEILSCDLNTKGDDIE